MVRGARPGPGRRLFLFLVLRRGGGFGPGPEVVDGDVALVRLASARPLVGFLALLIAILGLLVFAAILAGILVFAVVLLLAVPYYLVTKPAESVPGTYDLDQVKER